MRHRCVEDDMVGVDGGDKESITMAATFSFSSSLSSLEESLDDSMSVI
jgi:hypothetical protein